VQGRLEYFDDAGEIYDGITTSGWHFDSYIFTVALKSPRWAPLHETKLNTTMAKKNKRKIVSSQDHIINSQMHLYLLQGNFHSIALSNPER
jgi:hypothetical protein